MRLVMTLLVRNEEDILRANLDFHFSRGVDFVVATDNLSRDSTPDILRAYEKQGRLHMIREKQDDYSQDLWVTRMARLAATQFHADWVINNDADEFWWPLRGNLKEALSQYGREIGVVLCQRLNFVCRPRCGESPFYEVMFYRQAEAKNELGRPLPPKACHRAAPGVEVAQGNHAVCGVPGEIAESSNMEILHFPIRSWEQFAAKVQYGGAAYARNTRLSPAAGRRWRVQYNMIQDGTLADYFRNLVCSDTQLKHALTKADICEDRRLSDAIREINTSSERADQ